MIKLTQILCLLLFSTVVTAESEEQMIMESNQSIKLFSQQLKSKLKQGMQTGGPKQAIQICNIEAENITRQISEQHGWKIGRTSLKVRNSNNTPDEWEVKVLRYFELRKKRGDAIEELDYSEIVDSANSKVFRYMKAIPTQGLCLSCHGDKLPAAITNELQGLYPADQATGFDVGDIRGAFSITRHIQ